MLAVREEGRQGRVGQVLLYRGAAGGRGAQGAKEKVAFIAAVAVAGVRQVSISHYIRAYFNYKALKQGEDFGLPGGVGFLNVSAALLWFCRSRCHAVLTVLLPMPLLLLSS